MVTGGSDPLRAGPGRPWLGALNAVLVVALVAVVVGPRLGLRGDAEPPGPPAAPPPAAVTAGGLRPATPPRGTIPAAEAPGPVPAGLAATEEERETRALWEAGRIAEACERLRVLAHRPAEAGPRRDYAGCLARLGQDAYQTQQPAAAAGHYGEAVRVYPEGRELWGGLARIHAGAGQLDRAQAVLDEALALFPEDADLSYLRAETLERQGRTAQAIEVLRRLVTRQPAHARAPGLLLALEREQRVEDGYGEEESPHFLVRYEGSGGRDVARAVIEALEEAHGSMGRDLEAHPPFRVQVGVYRAEVLGRVTGLVPHRLAGAFDGRKIRLNLAAVTPHSRGMTRLVRHEYAHVLIHQITRGRAPAWVHEGLAQVLEPRPAPRTLSARAPAALLTLAGLGRLSSTMEPETYGAGYQLSHVAVEHLVDRGGLAGVRAFLLGLGRDEAVSEALRAAFGVGFPEVEARLSAVAGRS